MQENLEFLVCSPLLLKKKNSTLHLHLLYFSFDMTLWRSWRICRDVCWWQPARLTSSYGIDSSAWMWLWLIHKVKLNRISGGKERKGGKGKCLDSALNGVLHFPSRFFQIHHCQPLQFWTLSALSYVTEAKNLSCYHWASKSALVCDFPTNSVTSLTSFCNFATASGIMKPLICNKSYDCDQPILIRVLEQDERYTYNVTVWARLSNCWRS